MTRVYRTGGHWKRTIVEIGTGPEDEQGRRFGDRLAAWVDTQAEAELIVALLNDHYSRLEQP